MADPRLRDRTWRRFLQAHDGALVEELYNPALGMAVGYDRCCAYFSSSVLAVAARGFGAIITRFVDSLPAVPPAPIRLLVNEEMSRDDVQALTEGGDLSVLETILLKRLQSPQEFIERDRLALLGFLVKRGWLEVRVGVLRKGGGILHSKFGVVRDASGDALMFRGSANESAHGLQNNVEHVEVTTSWEDPGGYEHFSRHFEQMWNNEHPAIETFSLPDAVEKKLISFAPGESDLNLEGMIAEGTAAPPPASEPDPIRRRRAAMLWRYLVESSYMVGGEHVCDATALVGMWPHQRRVVEETTSAWPDGRLLCDEVGMGKTIEAILVLRRLLAGRGVRRVLFLLPAGLLRQWQGELREKGGLLVPRLQGTGTLIWPGGREEPVDGLAEALRQPLLLVSREMARLEGNLGTLLSADEWDIVLLDESHAARRLDQKEGAFNQANLLLKLLRELQLKGKAKSFLLLSATPMQTQPWEPWDLLGVLGEGGHWLAEFKAVRQFYEAISALESRVVMEPEVAQATADVLLADDFVSKLPDGSPLPERQELARKLRFAPHGARHDFAKWLRAASPISRRIHRNTRDTLREYHRLGILEKPPARRRVEDFSFEYQSPGEREIYDELARYIDRRFDELEGERPGKGFVMTIYQRRMASSPYAITQSLKRRCNGLERVVRHFAVDSRPVEDLPEGQADDEWSDGDDTPLSAALPTDPEQAERELGDVRKLLRQLSDLHGKDTKRDRFFSVLQSVTLDGRAVLVFTEYSDTLEYLRDFLADRYQSALGTYSGDGGRIWQEGRWIAVTKDVITRLLRERKLRILLCTDAASEGLNLQAAGAVINYDLPWNPSKVEQRIGRVDRIGQELTEIRVINFFLESSVDQRVYAVLRERCQMFEGFIGRMQPVLARAQKMLLGREPADTRLLEELARNQGADILARESFVSEEALPSAASNPIVSLECVAEALRAINGTTRGVIVTVDGSHFGICGIGSEFGVGLTPSILEANPLIIPPNLTDPALRRIADFLERSGECLPLIVESAASGSFRCAEAVWLDQEGGWVEVTSFAHLQKLIADWDGSSCHETKWKSASDILRAKATARVKESEGSAAKERARILSAQRQSVKRRLLLELGRYLGCQDEGFGDLNGLFYRLMTRDMISQHRLIRCHKLLGNNYPEWAADILWEIESTVQNLAQNRKQARLIGSELEAALVDPRWKMAELDSV